MDYSKNNQTELEFSCGLGISKLNVYTGRMSYEFPMLVMGANSFRVESSLIFNNHFTDNDFGGRKIGIGKGWKINLQQYLFPYDDDYNLDGFSENDEDYVYIDPSWTIHKFVKYKSTINYDDNRCVYYDANGTGLRLIVGVNRYPEILDGNNNIIRFDMSGNIIEVISAINPSIVKIFQYDANNNLKYIYDSRKPNRKMIFTYNANDKLIGASVVGSNISVTMTYENDKLVTISKSSNNKARDYLYFNYNLNNTLSKIINSESLKALEFTYDNSYSKKVTIVKNGVMKEILGTQNIESEIFLGDCNYLGDYYYLTNKGKKLIRKYLEMPNEYVKSRTVIEYQDYYTDLINNKNMRTRYYFTIEGYTASILENYGNNNKTLFKTSGWELSNVGNSQYKINGKNANFTTNNKYTADITKLNNFKDEFRRYSNLQDSKYKYNENFVVSFWVKMNGDITGEAKAVLYAKKMKGSRVLNEIYKETYIAHAKANSWQYVTIPINLGEEQYNLNEISISFINLENNTVIEVADMRIAIGNSNSLMVYDFNNPEKILDLDSIVRFDLVYKDKDNSIISDWFPKSTNFYMTEGDIFATYKSLFYMRQKNQLYFDFICCGGSKVFNVSHVSFCNNINRDDSSCIDVSLNMNTNGEPNYYIYSSNRNAENKWSITEVQNLFKVDPDDNIYYEIITGIQILDSPNDRIDISNCSYTYEQKNINGSDRKSRDEYGVITSYEYDSYGNLNRVVMYNENRTGDLFDRLVTEYTYSTSNESLREKPISCTKNGIVTNYNYIEPEFLPNSTQNGVSILEYSYDNYKEKIINVKNKNDNNVEMAQNTFRYDQYGNIISASDLNLRTIGYIYNVFGEPVKYYENSKLLLEKEVEETSDYQIITEKTYNNTKVIDDEILVTPYITKTKLDNYGRILSQENKSDSDATSDIITFEYQSGDNHQESESVQKISKINDPYNGQQYNFIYDDENRPSGYETTANGQLGIDESLVRQIGNGDTQYYFGGDDKYYVSKIIKDDTPESNTPKYINPRIIETKYADMDDKDTDEVTENYKEVDCYYTYDYLGRLKKKKTEGIKYRDGDLFNPNNTISFEKNINYKKGSILPSKIEYAAKSLNFNIVGESAKMYFENTYDSKGNIINIKASGERFVENPISETYLTKANLVERNYSYNYDAFDRLLSETRIDDNSNSNSIEYDYSQTSDHLRSVTINGNVAKEFRYNNGKRSRIKLNNEWNDILYDNFGNVIKDEKATISYNSRNLLDEYNYNITVGSYLIKTNKNKYKYNYQGVRYSKDIDVYNNGVLLNTKRILYFLDGSRILGEKQVLSNETKILKYLYDAEGIAGINYDGCNFTFVKDSLGNVSKLMYQGKVIGEYIYDAWGNCVVNELSIDSDQTNGARDRFVLNNNPFRWKSHYLDLETGLYYVNGRYYSPVLMQYLNANNIENINVFDTNSFDRLTITVDNSITYECNPDTIFTNNELYPDPTYEPIKKKTWWEINWKKAVQWICFTVVLIVGIVLTCIPATSEFGIGMLYYGLKAAISGAIIGGVISGVINLIHGNKFIEGFTDGFVYGFINGFTTGALMFCASQAVSALSKAVSSRCTSPGQCFIAGTLVLTSLGNKKIEDIEIGDEVWSYDEKTGDKSLKKVAKLFRNKTKKWIHLLIKIDDVNIEEIICTEEHPFYVSNVGWINASDLLANDSILIYNGIANVIRKEVEELNAEETTYNFEVEDYHTYYVGENNILVHNDCTGSYEIEFSDGKKYIGKGSQKRAQSSADRISKKYGVKVKGEIKWTPAEGNSHIQAFKDEYIKMLNAGFEPNINGLNSPNPSFYNKIWSPGRLLMLRG